ncbi:MAG: GGDEF domain-containing protein [Natronospirillum sp.]|uniref:GGDEF domain-containing protein n=1 Tax=Natronospirillum sp. TaxID=2812955 RepID=UPI0025F5075A|nr:GGDEF domain-containing protein [Natronospirillum sp.]MCH8552577.1 GGDEF domain-containing protein [Natronospirillum sp.]
MTSKSVKDVALHIHPFWATFTNAAQESAFRASISEYSRHHLQVAFYAWAMMTFLFLPLEFAVLGHTTAGYMMVALRVVVGLMVLTYALATMRWHSLAEAYPLISVLQMIGMTPVFLLYFIRPELAAYTVGATLVVIFAVYQLIPNLVTWCLLIVAYIVVGTTLSLAFALGLRGEDLAIPFFILLIPVLIGAVLGHRYQFMQRTQFALLKQAEQTNAELAEEVRSRKRLEETLAVQAQTDSLTGLFNRNGYEPLFEHEFARARREGRDGLAMALLDLDHFKSLNDTHGHAAGDTTLRALAGIWSKLIRETDVLGRLGGEEFVLLLPGTPIDEAQRVVERLREATSETPVRILDAEVPVTVTIGLTQSGPDDKSYHDLLKRADRALYAGKRAGRNRVHVKEPSKRSNAGAPNNRPDC